ncbi:MMPL family transporter [Streptomyces sp. IB2014 016-6]|uniref:MMPL family transporter n=1 Tax=Streptomyces sp. IB2014 016-6 TaxID=2517818 RepID=UPI0011CC86BB|nr:MMPL family transporter [Streptomyces sp. IB2014 016-6]TXL90969.1 MMPL family transporter [Streptomyces sp. IB2014 016-6]
MLRRIKSERAGLVESVAGWSARNRTAAIAAWLLLVAIAVMSGSLFPGEEARATDPGEAGRGQRMVSAQDAGDSIRENVMIRAGAGAGPATRRAATKDLVAALRAVPDAVWDVGSPLGAHGGRWVSGDGTADLVTFEIAGPDAEFGAHRQAADAAVEKVTRQHPGARVDQAGDSSLASAVDDGIKSDMRRAETTSLPLTVVILLVVFGSLTAAGIPLLLSATAVAAAFGLLDTLGRWVPFNSAASAIVLLIGMAVGIDYSLFYLRRIREERAAGHPVREALRIASRTSGHAVLVSGLTVMVCMTGLLFTGVDVFKGLTLGTVLVVALAVLGSVTALPALVAALGDRVDLGRIPWLGRRRTAAGRSRLWTAVAGHVVRRPLLTGGVAALLLAVMALPAFGMHLQDATQIQSLPRGVSAAADAGARMQQVFPGVTTPARVVVSADRPEIRAAADRLHEQAARSDGALREPITMMPVGEALVIRVPLAGAGTDPRSERALEFLRERALPATVGAVEGVGRVEVAVAGRTAMPYDFTRQVNARTPLVFAFVLVLAFVLLAVAFGSLALPLVSIALNLLSIGAAYGVLVAVFQGGRLESLLDFNAYGGVVSWLPLFMFIILFGLSMDYHIFILSRIRERWTGSPGGRDTSHEAIVGGIAASAGVVTSAAAIMVGVFSVFTTLSSIEYKMLGTGMAVAILIDATVVRGVLLPASLTLLGDRAWTMPGRWGRGGSGSSAGRHEYGASTERAWSRANPTASGKIPRP